MADLANRFSLISDMIAVAESRQDASKIDAVTLQKSEVEKELNRTEKAVLSIIKAQPKGKGINAKSIIKQLSSNGVELAESTLRRHILPKLIKKHGVVSHRAAGGYFIP